MANITEGVKGAVSLSDSRALFLSQTRSLMINIVSPIELILGTFGNVMVIVIFRRMKDQSSMSIYFTALAISDTVFLYFGLGFFLWCRHQFNFVFSHINDFTCKLNVFLNYACSATSSWFLVAMTTQRAASVIWPHRVNILCTRKTSIVTVCVIVGVVCLLYSHILYGFYVDRSIYYSRDCLMIEKYLFFFRKYWAFADMAIVSFGPFAILLFANVVLLWKVVASVKSARHTLAAGQAGQVRDREKKTSSMTVTLITLSVAFFVLTAPVRIFLLTYAFFLSFRNMADVEYLNLISEALNLVFVLNSSINFYLYCLSGQRFRTEFLSLFSCISGRREKTSVCSQSSVKTLDTETDYKQLKGASQ